MEVVFLADVQKPLATAEQFGGNCFVSLHTERNALHGLEFPAGFDGQFGNTIVAEVLRTAEMEAVRRRHGGIWKSKGVSAGKIRSAERARGLEFHQHQLGFLFLLCY